MNAFIALTAGQHDRRKDEGNPKKRKKSSSTTAELADTKRRAGEGSHLQECPSCQRLIHRRLLASHVDQCLSSALAGDTSTSQQTHTRTANVVSEGHQESTLQNNGKETHVADSQPTSDASHPSDPRRGHERTTHSVREPTFQHDALQTASTHSPPTSFVLRPVAPTSHSHASPSDLLPDAKAAGRQASQPNNSDKRNAFAVLAQNASIVYETHVFFLGVCDGQWKCAMWLQGTRRPDGVPSEATCRQDGWASSIKVQLPALTAHTTPQTESGELAKQQVVLTLMSNIRPQGAASRQSPPLTQAGNLLLTSEEAAASLRENPERTYLGAPPLLKSALQKCVRRGKAAEAERVAHALLSLAPADALRRCPIICLEDSMLHPHLPALVWMMCAQPKGYVLTADHRALVLATMGDVAACPVHDCVPDDLSSLFGHDSDSTSSEQAAVPRRLDFKAVDAMCEEPDASLLVKCLLLRAAYGGMQCDVSMALSYATVWLQRFVTDNPQTPLHPPAEPKPGGMAVDNASEPPAPSPPTSLQPSLSRLEIPTDRASGLERTQPGAAPSPSTSQPCSTLQNTCSLRDCVGERMEPMCAGAECGDEQASADALGDCVHGEGVRSRDGHHSGDASAASSPRESHWLALLARVNSYGERRPMWRMMRPRDIPLEAVDHHISNLVTVLMKDDFLMDSTLSLVDTPGEFHREDPHQVLRSLIWSSRSGVNFRQPLCLHDGEPVLSSHDALNALVMSKDRPTPVPSLPPMDPKFWTKFAAVSDAFARNVIKRAFRQ